MNPSQRVEVGNLVVGLSNVGHLTVETTEAFDWRVTCETYEGIFAAEGKLLTALKQVTKEAMENHPIYVPKHGCDGATTDFCSAAVMDANGSVRQCARRGLHMTSGGIQWCNRHLPRGV